MSLSVSVRLCRGHANLTSLFHGQLYLVSDILYLRLSVSICVALDDERYHALSEIFHREWLLTLRCRTHNGNLGPGGLFRLRKVDQVEHLQLQALIASREELLLVLSLVDQRRRESECNQREVKDSDVRQVFADIVHLAQVNLEGH